MNTANTIVRKSAMWRMHEAVISGLHFSTFNDNYLLLAANSPKDKAPFDDRHVSVTSSWEYSQTDRIHVHSYDAPTWSAVFPSSIARYVYADLLYLHNLEELCKYNFKSFIYYVHIFSKLLLY